MTEMNGPVEILFGWVCADSLGLEKKNCLICGQWIRSQKHTHKLLFKPVYRNGKPTGEYRKRGEVA